MRKIHCPYCSKDVEVNAKGRLVPHIVGKRIKCIASGFEAKGMEWLSNKNKKIAEQRGNK
jgi:hypothetical protein